MLVKVLIPISTNWHSISDEANNALNNVVDGQFSLNVESFFQDKTLEINFKKIERNSLKPDSKEHTVIKNFLAAECEIETSSSLVDIKEEFLWKKDTKPKEETYALHVADEIIEGLFPFIICCNLAAPGLLNVYENFLFFIEGKQYSYHVSFGHEFHEFLDPRSLFYKRIKVLDIPKT